MGFAFPPDRGFNTEQGKTTVATLPPAAVTASSSPARTPGLPWAINARDGAYGAKGDGSTDDTASIGGALSTGRDIFLPNGTYIVDGLNYTTEHGRIWAESRQGVVLKAKTGAASGYAVRISGKRYCALENLTIDGNGTTNADGLHITPGAATSQSQSFRRLLVQNAAKGVYIDNAGATQADKNTFYDTVFVNNAISFQSDSVNSQETIFIGVNVGFSANGQVGFKLNASGGGSTLGILGGQCQGNGVATGLVGIQIAGVNLGWIWLRDYIDENVQTSIDGSASWPVSGVILEHATLQGTTANLMIGPINASTVGGTVSARQCSFKGSGAVSGLGGNGIIKSYATGVGPKVILEDCNLAGMDAPQFTTNGGALACRQVYPNLAAGVLANKTGATSVTSGVATALPFDALVFQDVSGMHDNVTNNTRLTCVTPGRYAIQATACFDVSATGQRQVAIKMNGANFLASAGAAANPAGGTDLHCATTQTMAAGDYVELFVLQSSGGALNVGPSNVWGGRGSQFGMELLHG